MADDVRIHDGRFGERFDSEVDPRGIGMLAIGLAVTCALGMLITWGIVWLFAERAAAAQPPPSPVAEARERQLPPSPRLQTDPEAELIEMRRELDARLNGYGWVDEVAGEVHIPIDRAIDILLTEGLEAVSTVPPGSDDQPGDPTPAPATGTEMGVTR